MLCPPLMHNSKLALFMTEGVKDVQMFPSLICLRHVRLEWRVPVSMPVSETQWISKTHSQAFILCCWNNNVSRDPRPSAQTSERIRVLHLHDLPHFSIWDRRLHHLTSSKQLKGFIIRRAAMEYSGDTSLLYEMGFFSSDGMCSWWSVLRVEGGESVTPSLTLPTFCSSSLRVWTVNLWVSAQLLSPSGGRQSSTACFLFVVSHSSMRHSRCSQWRSFLGRTLLP